MTETEVGILACERLKVPHSNRLQLQSYIPNALNNLARQVANDPLRRRLLLTNQSNVTATISTTNYNSSANLNVPQGTAGIMLEYLQYGTIYYIAATKTWTNANVDDGTDTITIAGHGYVTGQAVRLTTAGTLPSPLLVNQTYYVIVVDTATIQLANTLADALAGTAQALASVGAGTSTMTAYQKDVTQWLASPTQGMLNTSIPFPYIYIWLEQNLLYTNRTNGTFAFSVPYIPTLDVTAQTALPAVLESDLIDAIVQLAVTSGFSPIPPSAQ